MAFNTILIARTGSEFQFSRDIDGGNNQMYDYDKNVLERHLLRLTAEIDGRSSAKRRIRTDLLRTQLLENNVEIDKKVNEAIEEFNNRTIGWEALFTGLQGKIPIP